MSNVIVMSKPYKDYAAIDTVIRYCIANRTYKGDKVKCDGFVSAGVSTINLEEMIYDMYYMKSYLHNTEGKQLSHFIINLATYKMFQKSYENELDKLYNASVKIANDVKHLISDLGYQVCIFRHIDTNVPHLHVVINSVNLNTGTKIRSDKDMAIKIMELMYAKYKCLNWGKIRYNPGRPYDEEACEYKKGKNNDNYYDYVEDYF